MLITISLSVITTNKLQSQELSELKEIKIGILSKRGAMKVHYHWSETAQYLQQKIPEYQFKIVPLKFDDILNAIETKKIDLLLTNSAMFVDLSFTHQLYPLATVKRKILGQAFTEFGSVVFTRTERDGLNWLTDLAEQDVGAVNEHSLGGWIAALRELDSIGSKVEDFNSLEFLGTHDAVVYAVENRSVDVGIVRTDTLERMAEEGKIILSTFKILKNSTTKIKPKNNDLNFPFFISSQLYPEWPIVSLEHVPDTLSDNISSALIIMSKDSKAASQANIMGWTIPKNYHEIRLAFKQLNLSFYKQKNELSLQMLFNKYWLALIFILSAITLFILLIRYIFSLKNTAQQYKDKALNLRQYDPLTKLPNRRYFFEKVNRHLFIALREHRKCILLIIHLEKLDNVSQRFGYHITDRIIQRASIRVLRILSHNNFMGKLSDRNFVVLLSDEYSVNHVESLLQEIINEISLAFVTKNGFNVEIGCCIGASTYPNQATTLKILLKKSNDALLKAKKRGPNNFETYSSTVSTTVSTTNSTSTL